jgi:hypothetical protein
MAETSKGSASGGSAAGEVIKQSGTDVRAAMNYPLVKVCAHAEFHLEYLAL